MVGISTLGTLKSQVAATISRSDLTAFIPEWIDLARVDLNTRFRTAGMETSSAFTMTAGSPIVSLPSNFSEARRVQYTVTSSDIRELELGPFSPLSQEKQSGQPGYPEFYSIVGASMHLDPTPSEAWSGTIYHYQGVTAFDYGNDSATNWLLTAYPNTFLYGALLFSLPKIGSHMNAGLWERFYESAVQNVIDDDRSKRFAKAPIARVDPMFARAV